MKNKWTGGQYSLFRMIFGLYLFIHFFHLSFWATEVFSSSGVLADANSSPLLKAFPNIFIINDSPIFVTTVVILSAISALFFAIGIKDKLMAIFMWYVLSCLFGRNPLTSNPSLPFVGWMLLAHCIIPSNPLGSFQSRKTSIEELQKWHFPNLLFLCAWILMSLAYSYSGIMKLSSPSWTDGTALYEVLNNPLARPTPLRSLMLSLPIFIFKLMTWGALALEIFFPILSLSKKLRPWTWLAMLLMHFGLVTLIQFADLSFGMIILHLFTFNPSWIKPKQKKEEQIIFYDGECGLCHRWVKLVLLELSQNHYKFAPLQGEKLKELLSDDQRKNLPDSVILYSKDCGFQSKSLAIIPILNSLGGLWRIFAIILSILPKSLLDLGYDLIAKIRHKIFKKEKNLCPILPKDLQIRFLS